MVRRAALALAVALSALGCTNDPYPKGHADDKVLYSVFDEAPKTLDPAVAYTTVEHDVTGSVFDTLVEYHYLKRPYELIPGLAEAIPEPENLPDGKVRYQFKLRPGLLFQNDPCFELGGKGRRTRQITSKDFAFELKRIADPAVNSPVIESFGAIDGFVEFSKRLTERRKSDKAFAALPTHEQYERVGELSGVKSNDDLLLEIVLTKPYPQILYWFAMPFASPLPWEAVEYYDGEEGRDSLADHPVASGPYLLSKYDKQLQIVLEKNPNWYGVRHPEWKAPGATYPSEGAPGDAEAGLLSPEYVGQPLPFIERVEFRREKETIPTFNKFLQGYYDTSGVSNESFDKVVRDKELTPEMKAMGVNLNKSVFAGTYYLGFNMDDPVVGKAAGERSKKLRQAMSLAVDFKEFSRIFLNDRGVPAQTPIPPGLFGYDPDYKNPYRQVDLGKAAKLLVEAGYANGVDPKTKAPLHLTFDVGSTDSDRQLQFKFYTNEWRKIGLNVTVEATSYNKFQQKVRDGAYQIFIWGWMADYPDPENFLFLLWSQMARSKNNGPNTANFSDPEYDRLFSKMSTMENSPERLAIIQQMRGILEDQRPWIELYHPENYALYHQWLFNVKTPGLSLITTKYRDLDPKLRAEKRREWNEPRMWPAYLLIALIAAVVIPGIRTFMRERQ
jgi:ABC-type transport system substrate-binding protein